MLPRHGGSDGNLLDALFRHLGTSGWLRGAILLLPSNYMVMKPLPLLLFTEHAGGVGVGGPVRLRTPQGEWASSVAATMSAPFPPLLHSRVIHDIVDTMGGAGVESWYPQVCRVSGHGCCMFQLLMMIACALAAPVSLCHLRRPVSRGPDPRLQRVRHAPHARPHHL